MARLALTILFSAMLAACGASSEHVMDAGHSGAGGGAGGGAGHQGDAGGQDGSDAGNQNQTSDAGTDAGTQPLAAPNLNSVQLVVHGTMKLDWQNPAGGCDTIAISRKSTGSYAVVQTVAGTLTSANDSPGHASGTFCYTLACTRGGLNSVASNERCASQ